MSETFLSKTLKSNWYLFLGLAIAVGAGVVLYARSGSDPSDVDASNQTAQPTRDSSDGGGGFVENPGYVTLDENEKTRARIAEFKVMVDDPGQAEELKLNLRRIANLYYSKLQEFENAAYYYEELIRQFPEWDQGINAIYPNLAACYENLHDMSKENWTYRRMMEAFEPENASHQFAKEKLGL